VSDHRDDGAAGLGAEPLGVILAGGEGRRIGGQKAVVQLAGRPLITYPLGVMRAALKDVVVVAKPDTELPELSPGTVWIERAPARHPLAGILEALKLAEGRGVMVCAADLPFVSPALITRIARGGAEADVAVAAREGMIQPLLASYSPAAGKAMGGAPNPFERPLRELVSATGPRLVEVEDPDELFNVNAPEDLLQAAAILDRRRAISRT
jgi:molybdenum cofactor guanylyltransferase